MLNFASTGSGTANHLAVEMLAKQADIKVTTVFYKGSAEGIADVIAGRTTPCSRRSTAMPQIQAGKLKAIAVTSTARTALAPDVPTMAEAGLPGYEVRCGMACSRRPERPPSRRAACRGGDQGGRIARICNRRSSPTAATRS